MPDHLAAIRERLVANYRDQPAMVWQDIAWLIAQMPTEGITACPRCGWLVERARRTTDMGRCTK